MSKYFYHGVLFSHDAFQISYAILKSKRIKTKRELRFSANYGYNGMDYISVCRKESHPKEGQELAFDRYIYNHFCFILRDDLPAIKPIYIGDWSAEEYQAFILENEGEDLRMTDMIDEWQVKGGIPSSYIIGMGIPVAWIEKNAMDFLPIITLRRLKKIIRLAEAFGIDIIDSSEEDFVERYEAEKENQKRITSERVLTIGRRKKI